MSQERDPKLPEMSELIKGRIYKIDARNFSYGAWNGKDSFIGIREKFGSRFLDEEMHWDADKNFGTVEAVEEDTGVDVDEAMLEERVPGLLAALEAVARAERER
jgi:hypothetical protein